MIYDSVGSLSTPRSVRSAAGRRHSRAPFNPLDRAISINDRDHRKMLLADGSWGMIGGVNLSPDYQSGTIGGSGGCSAASASWHRREAWHDADLEIEGPAVRELKRLFEQHWMRAGRRRRRAWSPQRARARSRTVTRWCA